MKLRLNHSLVLVAAIVAAASATAATPGLLAQVPAADLERELQDKADDHRIYPVAKIGVSYAF